MRKKKDRKSKASPSSAPSPASLPKLFLGSSSEAKEIAKLVAEELSDVAEVHPWWSSPSFRPMASTLQSLTDACRDFYDFGLFLLSPDDKVTSRGKQALAARDNVWFELGLFLGALGDTRAFAVEVRETKRVKIASDLAGINIAQLQWGPKREKSVRALPTVLDLIKTAIQDVGRNHGALRLATRWEPAQSPLRLNITLSQAALQRHSKRLLRQSLVAVARIEDDSHDFWHDERIYASRPREVSSPIQSNIVLTVPVSSKVHDRDVHARIFLIPRGVSVDDARTMGELRDRGCLMLQRVGVMF